MRDGAEKGRIRGSPAVFGASWYERARCDGTKCLPVGVACDELCEVGTRSEATKCSTIGARADFAHGDVAAAAVGSKQSPCQLKPATCAPSVVLRLEVEGEGVAR